MEISDVLKIQNRFLETQLQTESIKALKDFNDELIEKLEFKSKNPTVYSEEITRILVKNGLIYFGESMGKSSGSYETPYNSTLPRIYFGYSNAYEDMCYIFIRGNEKYKLGNDLTLEIVNNLFSQI